MLELSVQAFWQHERLLPESTAMLVLSMAQCKEIRLNLELLSRRMRRREL